MKVTITAPKDFEKFLQRHHDKVSLVKTEEAEVNGSLNANYGDILINIAISFVCSVISPFFTDAIKEYINETKQEVVVKYKGEYLRINEKNVIEMTNLLHENALAIIEEKKNV